MTVAVLLVTIMVTIISRALQISQRNSDMMSAYSSAAAAVDLIATDLVSLAVNNQPYEYLQARPETAPFQSFPASLQPPMRLMMLVDSPADSAQPNTSVTPTTYPDSGQVHAVSYLICWQNPLSNATASNVTNSVFGLYRQVASAATTFSSALGTTDLYNALYVNGTTPAFSVPPSSAAFVTANVVDLQVGFYVNTISTGGTGNPAAGALIQPPIFYNGPSNPPVATPYYPYQKTEIWGTQMLYNGSNINSTRRGSYGPAVYAEISVTVLEDAGAKLWGTGTGTGQLAPSALKLKYGHTITRKVTLRTPE